MKKKLYLPLIICVLTAHNITAQTGPGGIGNSTTNRVWFDASTIAQANGSFVSTWNDKSGNGLTATTSYTNSRPVFRTNQLNGYPSIDFDGLGDHLLVNNVSGISNQPISWFIVGNFNTLSSSQAMLHFAHSGTANHKNLRFTICYNSGSVQRLNSGNLNTSGGGTPSNFTYNTNTKIFSTVIGATTISTFSDGSASGSNTGTFLSPPNSNLVMTMGRRAYLNDMFLDGNISEVIVFNYQLNTPERVIVENYLSSKYNKAMTANDHYAYETGGYYYNVTGIGMEGGNTVTDSEGGTAITMSDASDLDNGDYLLWGHNNAAMTENLTDMPLEMLDVRGTRLNRVWRIDETNDVGTYTINVDMSGVSLGLDPNEYVILIDDDGDFTNGGTTIDSLDNSYDAINDIAIFTNKDLPDGAYFTIGFMPKTIISITDGMWSDPATWNCNCIPSLSTNVIIDETHEVTVDMSAGCNSLDITATGSLIFTGGNELELWGDLESLGSIDGTNGVVNFSGSFNQNIELSNPSVFDDLMATNSLSTTLVSGTITINGALTVNTGDFNIGTDLITLNSDASTTARIAPSSGTITGTMIVERFVDNQPDGWTNISSPVADATFAELEDDYALGFGDYIPDVSEPSAYSYNEAAWDYFPVETNTVLMNPGEGYEVYLATDYDSLTPFVATVAEVSGSPNMGDIPFAVTNINDGYNLLGNPYASFIDWSTFRSSCGVSLGTDFLYYDEAIDDYSTGSLGDEIAQSEGFWVEALGSGTLNFQESDKTASNGSEYRSAKEVLFALKVSSNRVKMKSHTYFRFDENADLSYVQGHDQKFLKLPDPKAPALFTHSSEGKKLRINELHPESEEMVIPVSFQAGIDGKYQIDMLNFDIVESFGYNTAVLEDKKTGLRFNLSEGPYLFEANTNDAAERFALHLSNNQTATTTPDIKFRQAAEGVWIEYPESIGSVVITIYNTLGQVIDGSVIQNTGSGKVLVNPANGFSGIFIIQVVSGDAMVSKHFYKN